IFDEVQCGLGRTGTLFAYEQGDVVPDMLTLAKPLAGGLPMGAVLVTDGIAAALKPGDHATTFGGGPLVASVALAVVRTIAQPDFLAAVREHGAWLGASLARVAARRARVAAVRGRGLMWGVELTELAAPFVAAARDRRSAPAEQLRPVRAHQGVRCRGSASAGWRGRGVRVAQGVLGRAGRGGGPRRARRLAGLRNRPRTARGAGRRSADVRPRRGAGAHTQTHVLSKAGLRRRRAGALPAQGLGGLRKVPAAELL